MGTFQSFYESEICIYTVVDCGALSDPVNGYVNYNTTTYNKKATYHCNQGYYRVGQQQRRCGESGHWSETPPICKGKLRNEKLLYPYFTTAFL